jgi:hypothetical protein
MAGPWHVHSRAAGNSLRENPQQISQISLCIKISPPCDLSHNPASLVASSLNAVSSSRSRRNRRLSVIGGHMNDITLRSSGDRPGSTDRSVSTGGSESRRSRPSAIPPQRCPIPRFTSGCRGGKSVGVIRERHHVIIRFIWARFLRSSIPPAARSESLASC